MFLLKDYTEQNPQFAETIRILESYDPGTAESVNIATKQLLQNDLFLKNKIESDKQELNNLIETNRRTLDTKISTTKTELTSLINTNKQNLDNKIDTNKTQLTNLINTNNQNINNKINNSPSIFYSETEPDTNVNASLWIDV